MKSYLDPSGTSQHARAISWARVHATHTLFGRIYCQNDSAPSCQTHSRQVPHTLSCITVLFVHAHTGACHVDLAHQTQHQRQHILLFCILYTPTTARHNTSHCTPLAYAHLDSTSLPPAQSAITCTIGTRQHSHCYPLFVLLYTSSMVLPYSVPASTSTFVYDAARTSLANSILTTTQHNNTVVTTALFYFL